MLDRETSKGKPESAVTLAKLCVAESGWHGKEDCAAIVATLRNRANGTSLERAAKRYNPRATGARAPLRERDKWVSGLNGKGTKPARFPAPWPLYAHKWQAKIKEVEHLLAAPNNPCKGNPKDWGGSMDEKRAARLKCKKVDCGKTKNTFYKGCR